MSGRVIAKALAFLAPVAFFLPGYAAGEGRADMSSKGIVDRVEQLTALRPFKPESISPAAGVELSPVPAESNNFFLVYRSTRDPGRTLSQVEVRTPTEAAEKPDGLLIIDVGGTECVDRNEIVERYGDGELSVPTPRQPAGSPLYLSYRRDWGWLRFGFSADQKSCLVSVVADATQRPA